MQRGTRVAQPYGTLARRLRALRDGDRRGTLPASLQAVFQRREYQRGVSVVPTALADDAKKRGLLRPVLVSLIGLGALSQYANCEAERNKEREEEVHELINWSGTHAVETKRYYQPETLDELKALVRAAHANRQKLRPIGSALSPNGLGFEKDGMVNLVMMDNILSIDKEKRQVKVQAGARVNQVVDALRPYGLTLENFASITEQQIGGFIQVGAHGTGSQIPPVDEQVVALKLITPAAGELDLSLEDDDPSLFQLARTSLGMIGIVAEVTLQCVPAHRLIEKTFVLSRGELEAKHEALMKSNKHLRYMWIPHTDSVVIVTCNPFAGSEMPKGAAAIVDQKFSESERLEAARNLLNSHPSCKIAEEQILELNFTTLRDELLALDPLNVDWVKKVNHAEAEFWRRSTGIRVDWSDRILQFDCGGQQWVSEVAFPVSSRDANKTDVRYVQSLLDMIEAENIPAPAPIEQRWTAPSFSPMSPAGEKPDTALASMYSWVGIIMYLPDATAGGEARDQITKAFKSYKEMCEERLWSDARAVEHWAKIEMPETAKGKALLQLRTFQKYPVEAFKAICSIFDPHGILRNDLTDTILGIESNSSGSNPAGTTI